MATRKGNKNALIHGGCYTRLYRVWAIMRKRCENPKCDSFRHYGAKGIKVCRAWLRFVPFRDWALANGYADHLQIDRIDPSKDYAPHNCRWVTPTDNARYKSTTKLTPESVSQIRQLLKQRARITDIARRFKISCTNVCGIRDHRIWVGV